MTEQRREQLPKPWKLWSNANYQLYRNGYIVLALGWALLMGVHLEGENKADDCHMRKKRRGGVGS
jgi:hypothetical protein